MRVVVPSDPDDKGLIGRDGSRATARRPALRVGGGGIDVGPGQDVAGIGD